MMSISNILKSIFLLVDVLLLFVLQFQSSSISLCFGCSGVLLVLFLCSCNFVLFVAFFSVFLSFLCFFCLKSSGRFCLPCPRFFFLRFVFSFYWIRLEAASPSLLIMGATAPASLCSKAASCPLLAPTSRESERERYSSYPESCLP